MVRRLQKYGIGPESGPIRAKALSTSSAQKRIEIVDTHAHPSRRIQHNTVRTHSSLGNRPPAPESIVRMDQKPTMH